MNRFAAAAMSSIACLLGAAPPAAAAKPRIPVAGARVAIDTYAQVSDASRTARRFRVVILQSWQTDRARALKRADRRTIVLAYLNLAAMSRADEHGNSSAGVTTQRAAGHPEWFLRTARGRKFTFAAYDWLWGADVGNRAYQSAWADRAVAVATRGPFDGIFMDDTNLTMRFHHPVSDIRPYATDVAYQRVAGSAVRRISRRVHASGRQLWANIGSWPMYPETAADWVRHLDGAMDEQFAKWGTVRGVGYNGYWEQQLANLKATQRAGKWFIGVAHSAPKDRSAARYGLATMMLGAGGRAAYAFASDYTHERVWPEFFYRLGRPRGPERGRGDGVHVRYFARGVAAVNPTTRARTVRFPRRYRGHGRACAKTMGLTAHSALVLRDCARR